LPNQQDFVLNLVAELDEGSVQSDAARVANTIASTIEKAFEGLGQKIADNILKGVQGGTQALAGALVDPSGRPIPSNAGPLTTVQPVAAGAPGGAPVMPMPSSPSQWQGGYHSSYLDMHAFPNQTASNIRTQIQRDILGGGGGGSGGSVGQESDPQALHTDIAYQRARQIKAMRDAGMNVELSGEEKEMFQGARSAGMASLGANREQQSKLGDEIEKLNKNVIELQKAMNESVRMTDQERRAKGMDDPEKIKAVQDTEKARLERMKQEMGQISQVSGAEAGRVKELGGILDGNRGGDFGRAIGIMSPIAMAAARAPGIFREADSASAATGNLESRSMAGGDLERIMAVQRLGGMDSLRTRGGLEAAGMAGATMLGAVGSFAMGGPIGMMAGAGLGVSAFQQVAGFETGRRGAIESRIGAEMDQNQELYSMNRAGRETAAGAFSEAQGLGDVGMSGFLTGNTSSRAVGRQMRNANMEWERQRRENISLNAAGFNSRAVMSDAEKQSTMNSLGNQFNEASSMSIGGQSFNEYGIGQGLVAPGQVQGMLSNIARGSGGSFLGQRSLSQDPSMIKNLIDTQAGGLGNTTDLFNSLNAGASGNTNMRGENAVLVKDMFESAVSGGLDKARVGQALMTVVAQTQGMGSAAMVGNKFDQAMGAAQNVFGKGGIEGAEMNLTQRTLGAMNQEAQGGVAGIRAARDVMKEFGIKGDASAELLLAQGDASPAALERMGLSKEQAQKASKALSDAKLKEQQQFNKEMYGGLQYGEELIAGAQSGAQNVEESFGSADVARAVAKGARADISEKLPSGIHGALDSKAFRVEKGIQEGLGQTGVSAAQNLAEVNATQISNGLISLGTNVTAVNAAFEKLITRAEQVLTGQVANQGMNPTPQQYNQNNKARAPGSK